jgi:magnesium transporter
VKNPLLIPELRELLAGDRQEELRSFLTAVHPATAAELLGPLAPDELRSVLQLADPAPRATIFGYLELDVQVELAELLGRAELATIVAHMSADERADLVQRMPEALREALLPALAHADREDIRRLASYRDGTAGSVMTSDYATIPADVTAAQAIEWLRRVAPDKETIYVAYVVDAAGRLIGHVSLRTLIVANSDRPIASLMNEQTVVANVSEDQEEVARKIAEYDLLALPVVDGDGRLVGIVTYDDAIDIVRQEQQEDLEKLMAITGSHVPGRYLQTPAFTHFRNRAGWVVGLAALGLISGVIIHSYENALERFFLLALYMPMVADTGGNTGSQSATVIVRALALGDVRAGDALRVLFKEFRVSLLLALILGVMAFAKVLFLSSGSDVPPGFSLPWAATAIAVALSIQVLTATSIGALLPLAAARLKLDPAVVSSPALTTVVDITGLLIYFNTTRLILGI